MGVIVRDLDKAQEFFSLLGIGPFEKSGTPAHNKEFHGVPLDGGVTKMVMGRWGDIKLQLTQPIEPPSMSYEFLQDVGQGVNHVAFEVDDIAQVTQELLADGYEIVLRSDYLAGGGEIYVNTGNNFCIQFFESPPGDTTATTGTT